MIVVADTSPINYLILLGHVEILPEIYGEVLIPQAVYDELQDSDAPTEVRCVALSTPDMAADQRHYLPTGPVIGSSGSRRTGRHPARGIGQGRPANY